jgi:hypothetical protein
MMIPTRGFLAMKISRDSGDTPGKKEASQYRDLHGGRQLPALFGFGARMM